MNPKGQHFVHTIKNSSNHLLNIINDILDVAALKEGKLTIKHELCKCVRVCGEGGGRWRRRWWRWWWCAMTGGGGGAACGTGGVVGR